MNKKQEKIRDHFQKELTDQTRGAADEPETRLLTAIEDQMDYDRGVGLYVDYVKREKEARAKREEESHVKEEEESRVEPLTRDYLLFSLLEKLPVSARLNHAIPEIRARGLRFAKKLPDIDKERRSRPGVMGRYVESVRTVIENVIVPRHLDVQAAMDCSGDYFFQRLKNFCYDARPRDTIKSSYPGIEVGDETTVLDAFMNNFFSEEDSKKVRFSRPDRKGRQLVEVSSGKVLTKELNIDPRLFFNTLFGLGDDGVFSEAKQILFSHHGIFYLEGKEVKLIPANEAYEMLFFSGNREELHKQRHKMQKLPRRTDDIIKYEQKLAEDVRAMIRRKCKDVPLSSFEAMADRIKSEFGMEIAGMEGLMGYVPSLRDERTQEILYNLLKKIHTHMPGHLRHVRISDHRNVKVDIDNKKEVALRANQLYHKLRMPKYLAAFMKKGHQPKGKPDMADGARYTSPDITLEDLRLLDKYPEYEKIVFHFILMEIFRSKIFLKEVPMSDRYGIFKGKLERFQFVDREKHGLKAGDTSLYEAFKRVVGADQINKECHLLQNFGFEKNSGLAEVAVLINYFSVFGGIYLQEEMTGIPDKRLPDNLRQFFRVYLSKKVSEDHMLEEPDPKMLTAHEEEAEGGKA